MSTQNLFKLKSLWPAQCLICLQSVNALSPVEHLCTDCLSLLPWNTSACARCAQPLPMTQPYCAHCLRKPLRQQRSYILFHYTSPISDWIHAAKFEASFLHCRLLSQLLSHTLAQRSTPWPHCVLPMPLHPRRLRQRGYNQVIEIARTICQRFAIPLDTHSLQRYRYHQPQSRLPLKLRQNNVYDSFQLRQPLTVSHIALLDDVSTSGHTLEAASRALLQQGALELEYWCIAKPF